MSDRLCADDNSYEDLPYNSDPKRCILHGQLIGPPPARNCFMCRREIQATLAQSGAQVVVVAPDEAGMVYGLTPGKQYAVENSTPINDLTISTSITFIAPPSGKVRIEFSGRATAE